jgi:hypothetical protein
MKKGVATLGLALIAAWAASDPAEAQARSGSGPVPQAVGGLTSVLLAVRQSSSVRGPAALELRWDDAIPADELVRYRILRSGGASVPDAQVVVLAWAGLLAAAALLVRRRSLGRALCSALALAAMAAWAAESQFWVPPNRLIGTTTQKQFVDPVPLPGYNTYQVIAERTGGADLPSNSAGAFVGGADGLTLVLQGPLAAGTGPRLGARGDTAAALVLRGDGAAALDTVRISSLAAVAGEPIPGVPVHGLGPALLEDESGALIVTQTDQGGAQTAGIWLVDPADGSIRASAQVPGAAIRSVPPLLAGPEISVVLLSRTAPARQALVLIDLPELMTRIVEVPGAAVEGAGPALGNSGASVLLAGGTGRRRLYVVSIASGAVSRLIPLPGAAAGTQIPVAGRLAYVPVLRGAQVDGIAEVDVEAGALVQTLELPGTLEDLALADGGTALIAAVRRTEAADALVEFRGLGQAQAARWVLPLQGELVTGARLGVSNDGRRAAVLTGDGGGEPTRLSMLNTRTAALIGSREIEGTPVDGIGPRFAPDGGKVLVATQGAEGAIGTVIAGTAGLEACSAPAGARLVPGIEAGVSGPAGTGVVASRSDAGADLLTLVRGLPEGLAAIPTRSEVSGSRVTALDFGCGERGFLLLPGALLGASSGGGQGTGRERPRAAGAERQSKRSDRRLTDPADPARR